MELVLHGDNGTRFTLSIENYQFPEILGDYDGNWLMMRGHVVSPMGTWEFRDACLLTWEYAKLSSWFRTLDVSGAPTTCRFMELNLEFQYRTSADGQAMIVVLFDLHCSPPWQIEHASTLPAYECEYPISLNDCRALADAIDAQLEKYPPRGEG